MIIAHMADLHVTDRHRYHALGDQLDWLVSMGNEAADLGAELIVVAGDIFHGKSTPAERNAMIDVVQHWAARTPVVMVRGNHDAAGDLSYLAQLKARHRVTTCDYPARMVNIAGESVVCIPWPRKAMLASLADAEHANVDTIWAAAVDSMRALLHGFGVHLHGAETSVLVAHAEIGSAILDSGQPAAGHCDIDLAVDDLLDVGADYVALGHIHKRQQVAESVRYAGSAWQTRWGEDDAKGCLLVDTRDPCNPSAIASPAPRLVDVDLDLYSDPHQCNGCHVRLTYRASETERAEAARAAASKRADIMAAGALSCVVNPAIDAVHRARAPEIQTAQTPMDKLRRLWAVREDTPARAAEILSKLNEIEQEASAT